MTKAEMEDILYYAMLYSQLHCKSVLDCRKASMEITEKSNGIISLEGITPLDIRKHYEKGQEDSKGFLVTKVPKEGDCLVTKNGEVYQLGYVPDLHIGRVFLRNGKTVSMKDIMLFFKIDKDNI